MEKVSVACFSAAALCGAPALAADLPVKAPIYQAPPAYNWTGLYIGVNLGASIGRDPTTQSDATSGQVLGSFTMSPTGFAGGGQIGYNWQFAPNWVVGLEGDFQGTSQSDSSCIGDCSNAGGGFRFTATQKLNWFATARARLGYTNGDWLWYATGGGAWGEIHNDFLVFTPTDVAGSANFFQTGWVVGGGVETHLWGGWTAKGEYLYMDLGSFTDVVPDPLTRHIFTMTSDIRDHIVRVGLNYKFY